MPTHSYVPARIAHTQFVVVVLMSYLVERGDNLMMVSFNRLIGVMVAALFSMLTLTRVLYLSLFLVIYC